MSSNVSTGEQRIPASCQSCALWVLFEVVQGLRRIDHGEIARAGLVRNANGVFVASRMVVERAGKPEDHRTDPPFVRRGLAGLVKLEAPMELRPFTLDMLQNRSHGSGQDFRTTVPAVAELLRILPSPAKSLAGCVFSSTLYCP